MGGQPATAPAADARADNDRVADAFGQAGRDSRAKSLGFNAAGSRL
jgi:hypothetical protein